MNQTDIVPASPSIGALVHYYPNAYTRLAAIVVNSRPVEYHDEDMLDPKRPALDLQVFYSSGKIEFKKDVPAFNIEEDEEELSEKSLKDAWTYPNEIAILQKEEDQESSDGINSNEQVDLVQN